MSGGSFFDRIDELDRAVGHGDLETRVEFNQVYAAPQERGFWETGPNAGVQIRNHPRGGGSHFLRNAIIGGADGLMEELARNAITPDGSDLVQAAINNGHTVDVDASTNAPVEFANLNRSGHITVTDDGAVVYERPPHVGRLSREQLDAQKRHGDEIDYGGGTMPRLG